MPNLYELAKPRRIAALQALGFVCQTQQVTIFRDTQLEQSVIDLEACGDLRRYQITRSRDTVEVRRIIKSAHAQGVE